MGTEPVSEDYVLILMAARPSLINGDGNRRFQGVCPDNSTIRVVLHCDIIVSSTHEEALALVRCPHIGDACLDVDDVFLLMRQGTLVLPMCSMLRRRSAAVLSTTVFSFL
jgi:hypothetical protein